MGTKIHRTNEKLITRFTDQPTQFPAHIRDEIEKTWDRKPVFLYAMADLDESMQFASI